MNEILKLELSNEIEKRHLKYFEDKIYPNFCKENFSLDWGDYQECHEKFMIYCKTNFEQLAIGKPKDLKKFFENIPKHSQKILIDNPTQPNKLNYSSHILNIFGYETFSSSNQYVSEDLLNNFEKLDLDYLKRYWTPYTFLFMSGIRVCPYCNRQYITPIYYHSKKKNKKIKLRADLDHFYSKKKYPYFSMSLYNLVPSCKFCNSSLKGEKEFYFSDVNPYEEDINDFFKFKFDIFNGNNVIVERNYLAKGRIDNFLDIFQIEILYKYHQNQAEELIKKKYMYPDTYLDELYDFHSEYFLNKKELKSFLIGSNYEKKKINTEVFSKFRRDLSMQLQFIDEDISEDLILSLKTIIK